MAYSIMKEKEITINELNDLHELSLLSLNMSMLFTNIPVKIVLLFLILLKKLALV